MTHPAADLETVIQRVITAEEPNSLGIAWALVAAVVDENGKETMLYATAPHQCVATTAGLHEIAHQHATTKHRKRAS